MTSEADGVNVLEVLGLLTAVMGTLLDAAEAGVVEVELRTVPGADAIARLGKLGAGPWERFMASSGVLRAEHVTLDYGMRTDDVECGILRLALDPDTVATLRSRLSDIADIGASFAGSASVDGGDLHIDLDIDLGGLLSADDDDGDGDGDLIDEAIDADIDLDLDLDSDDLN